MPAEIHGCRKSEFSGAESMKRNTVLFAAIALWLCIEMFIVGPFSVMPIFDYADSWLPIQQVLKANIFSHGVTNWFPSMGCGVDRLAQDHFYPYLPNLLSLMLPVWLSNPVAIFFQYASDFLKH